MKRKQLTCVALAGLLVPAMLTAPTALATEQATGDAAVKVEEAATNQPTVSAPVKEQATTSSQQKPKAPATTQSSSIAPAASTAPNTAPESSTVKPSEKPKTETTTSSNDGKTTSSTTASSEKPDKKPLDVEVLPPNVPTDTLPAINVLPTQTIHKGSAFDPMKGVTATDKTDGNITAQVKVDGTVDTNTVGEYLLRYSVKNSKGNEATQHVIVRVEEKNVGMYTIEIADFKLPVGGDYVQAIRERVVIKKPDGSTVPTATANIMVAGQHSTATPGNLAVEIAVVSEYNTVTKKIVNIEVVPTQGTIRMDVQASLNLEVGQDFEPYSFAKAYVLNASGKEDALAKASATGGVGIWAESNVDNKKAGDYKVTYTATASNGATITKVMNVKVTEKAAKRTPKILVDNKVMYVGDKLDEDMILAWAKTENPEDTIDGFKVTNGEIKVKLADNTLVEPGEHAIEFYASTSEGETSTKTITLTVKNRTTAEPTGDEKAKEETKNVGGTVNTGNGSTTSKKVYPTAAQSKKQLPKTGEETGSLVATIVGGAMILFAFVLKRMKREN